MTTEERQVRALCQAHEIELTFPRWFACNLNATRAGYWLRGGYWQGFRSHESSYYTWRGALAGLMTLKERIGGVFDLLGGYPGSLKWELHLTTNIHSPVDRFTTKDSAIAYASKLNGTIRAIHENWRTVQ